MGKKDNLKPVSSKLRYFSKLTKRSFETKIERKIDIDSVDLDQ
jgi:hypothetical protein